MIGGGTTSDDFSAIQWQSGPYFCKLEIDPTGGTNYNDYGTFQLVSVPYALYANTAATALNDNDTDNQNELQDLSQVLSKGNSAGGATITDVSDPVNANDVATKNYVDNALSNVGQGNKHYIKYALSLSNGFNLSSSEQIIKFDYKYEDLENLYDPSTGEYTVPETGYYLIIVRPAINTDNNNGGPINVYVRANNGIKTAFKTVVTDQGSSYHTVNLSTVVKLYSSQKVTISVSDDVSTRKLRGAEIEIIKL
jgi:hypothetical protein